jgi:uncharacterized protein (TIGR02145 family)
MADGSVYPLCNGKTYVPDTDECVEGVVVQFIKSCGDELYNVHEKFCVNDKTYDLCGGESYDIELEECVEGKKTVVYEKCGDEKIKIADAVHLFCAEFENKTTEEKTYQVYKYTTIEVKGKDYSETWMAENVNYKTDDSRCYENKESNCEIYGRLYSLAAAKNACPNGWRLPSLADWDGLIYAVNELDQNPDAKNNAGEVLKSSKIWNIGEGSDLYGFTALPASTDGYTSFYGLPNNSVTLFWSSSEYDTNHAYYWKLYPEKSELDHYWDKSMYFSVRCIRN